MNRAIFSFRPLLAGLALLTITAAGCGTNGPEATTGPGTGPTTASQPGTTAGPTSGPTSGPTPAPSSSKASCLRGWGSMPKASSRTSAGSLTGIQAGRHDCFDRLVVRVSAGAPGYRVSYVDVVSEDGSGRPVPLRGGARMAIVITNPAYDVDTGKPTYKPANDRELANTSGYRTFRQVAWAGSFEGQSTIGLGVRSKLPFRVLVLTNPGRIVVDVAHQW